MNRFIHVENVSKSFYKQPILQNVSFSIEKGGIAGLLGPNGAGKTTMIRLLNGVINPSSGSLTVAGFDAVENGDEIRKRSGVVTESATLYHELTAFENLVFFAGLYGVTNPSDRIHYLLESFGLTPHKQKKVGTFSTGMKKRLALAKALLHKPELLFLDEPTNGLDPEGIKQVIGYLKKINQEENVTILICTHVLQQLETICDSYLFIQNGELIESGKKDELEKKYLPSISLEVETTLVPTEQIVYQGIPYTRVSEKKLLFSLSSIEEVPPLLRLISNESKLYASHIINRDLESLYFAIRGEKK